MISEDSSSFTGEGLFSSKYNRWEKIQTVESFIKSVNKNDIYNCGVFNVSVGSRIKDESYAALKDKKWVIRFASTEYDVEYPSITPVHFSYGTLISDATILRLKFKYNGKVYNLGALDNMQTGSFEPINENTWSITSNSKINWKLILIMFLIILAIILLGPILPFIIKAVFMVIALPFKAIKTLIISIKKTRK